MKKYIVALDQGTTSSRAVVVDASGAVVAAHGIEFPQIYPKPGWVEHDPQQILSSQVEALRQAVKKAGIAPEEIAAIGIIVAVLNQLLIRSGREEQAMMTTLAGLIVVLMMIISQISVLFDTINAS